MTPTTTTPFAHLESTPLRSDLTGRTIWLNQHESALAVLPCFSPARLGAARAAWAAHVERHQREAEDQKGGYNRGLHPELLSLAEGVLTARDARSLARALDNLHPLLELSVGAASRSRRDGAYTGVCTRGMELLVLLWRHHLIAFPMGWVWSTNGLARALPTPGDIDFGPLAPLLAELRAGLVKVDLSAVLKLVLAVGGVVQVGDLHHAYFTALRPHVKAGYTTSSRRDPNHAPAKHPPRGLSTVTSRIATMCPTGSRR